MKNNLLVFIFVFLNICNVSVAEQYKFEVSKLDIANEGEVIYAEDGKVTSLDENLEINGKKFKYNKSLNILDVNNGVAIIKSNNLKIEFDELKVDENNLKITAKGNVNIYDLDNDLLIKSEFINLDKKKNILKSTSDSILLDKFNNTFKAKKFEYNLGENVLKIQNLILRDVNNNNFAIELAYIDTATNKLFGKDVSIDLNNLSFEKGNEPRLKGNSITYQNDITELSKGIFTACKKTDECPPWQLSAEKITHNKKKKSINYKNAWLKIYDVPVVYFPKFFHPDPTVKRQSGFLMPTFKNSPNKNNFFSIPYYKVLSDNKDITFTPRLYAKNQFLFQTEYREITKNSNILSDISIFSEKDDSLKSHFFYKIKNKFSNKKFENNEFNLKIQQTTNDTYIKGHKILSPIITNYDLLENSLNVKLSSDDLTIETDFIVFENLSIKTSDRYEYIFPKVNLTKKIENKTKLDGDFIFESENYIHNYQTNILEKININNLVFTSYPKSSNGFYNNYEFLIKNSNSDTENSTNFKENENYYLSGLFQFNSSLPLIKNSKNYQNILRPKLSLKLGPNNTKNISNNNNKLDVNNIYNLNRLSEKDTVEGGVSLTYGNDFIISDIQNTKEILSIKFANNLRLKENKDLPSYNQLSAKTSNFFGEVSYAPNSLLTTKYNFSTKNNLKDINYENLEATIKFNNFITTFDYLNENHNNEKNSYLLNKTSYDFSKSNNIAFGTRKNKKTNLTEYYNLIYQYKNDCLRASIEYNKDYYSDRDIKPKESIFFKLTLIPFGQTATPNLKQ